MVFITDVAAWKSEDGGKTWNDFRGASRIKTAPATLKQQHDLSLAVYEGRKQGLAMQQEAQSLKAKAITEAQKKSFATSQTSLATLNRAFNAIFRLLQDTDMPPTTQAVSAANQAQATLKEVIGEWEGVKNGLK